MQMSIALAVGTGGFLGALLRFYVSDAITRTVGDEQAFLGTMTVNLAGCLLIGCLAVIVARTTHLSPHAQRLLITGLLGSLTTFSTFALDSMNLLQQGRVAAAILNVSGNIVLGFLLVVVGIRVTGMMLGPGTDSGSSTGESQAVTDQ